MRLVIIGSCSIHLLNFLELVQDLADDILILTDCNCELKFNVKVKKLNFSFKNPFVIFKIRKILKDFNPTHIHIHQANSYCFFVCLASFGFDVKKILNVWGSDILVNPNRNFFLKMIVKFCLKNVDIVVGDSYHLLEESKKIYPKIKTQFFNFGIDIEKQDFQKQNIIYSNRLHKKNYNIDKVIISFSKFVKNHPNWQLIIAGDGEEREHLKKLTKKLKLENKVKFIGFVDKQTNNYYYSIAKIYVSIPSSDSISLSLVESILYKCIPFVSNIPANREIVKDYGFLEENLENIQFEKYKDVRVNEKYIKKIEKLFSKEENKKILKKIYDD